MRSLLLILFMWISVKGNALTAYQIDSMWHVFNDTKQPISERAYALYRLHFEYDDEDPLWLTCWFWKVKNIATALGQV